MSDHYGPQQFGGEMNFSGPTVFGKHVTVGGDIRSAAGPDARELQQVLEQVAAALRRHRADLTDPQAAEQALLELREELAQPEPAREPVRARLTTLATLAASVADIGGSVEKLRGLLAGWLG